MRGATTEIGCRTSTVQHGLELSDQFARRGIIDDTHTQHHNGALRPLPAPHREHGGWMLCSEYRAMATHCWSSDPSSSHERTLGLKGYAPACFVSFWFLHGGNGDCVLSWSLDR